MRLFVGQGLPFEMSLELWAERQAVVALVGILAEAAARGLSPRLRRLITGKWSRLFTATPGEAKALRFLEEKETE